MGKYKFLKKLTTVIGAVSFAFIVSVYAYSCIIESYNMQVQEFTDRGEISLADSYDSEESRVEDFFQTENSSEILKTTYEKLKTNKKLQYYEVLPQPIEYIGRFKLPKSTVDGEEDCIEQKIDGELLTPLKTLMINQLFAHDTALNTQVSEGEWFEKTQYRLTSDQCIPVVLGENYKEAFSIGDTFEGYYLGCKKIQFVVKGFFASTTVVALDNQKYDLDDYLVAPVMQTCNTEDEKFAKLLLLVKCEGYLHYNNKEEYAAALEEIKHLAEETGYKYSLPKKELENKNIFGITKTTATILRPLITFLFILGICWLYADLKAFVRYRFKSEKFLLICAAIILVNSLILGMLYLLSKYVNLVLFCRYKDIILLGLPRVLWVYIIIDLAFIFLMIKRAGREKRLNKIWTN